MKYLLFLMILIGCAGNHTTVDYVQPQPYAGCQKSDVSVQDWHVSCFICSEQK